MELERRLMPIILVFAGTANVLLLKYADNISGRCSDGEWRRFQHPVFQTLLMFLGEMLCYFIYKCTYWFLQRRGNGSENDNPITRGGHEFSPFSFVLPAFLDAIASILLFTGLYLTYVTSYQMIKGAAIIFVGIYGSIHLNQTLISRHWMAMFTISCGIAVILSIDVQRVFYDAASLPHADKNAILTGDLLIICAQVFHGAKIVYEEKHLKSTDISAMQATGLQGIFGFVITLILAVVMNFMPTTLPFVDNSRGVFDDLSDVFYQLSSRFWLCLALIAFIGTSACYNYATLNIIKLSSGANCILANGLCVILVWIAALLYEWEIVNLITLMGFIILQMGAIAYRNAIFLEWYRSLLARLQRRRYADLTVDGEATENNTGGLPTSRPADLI